MAQWLRALTALLEVLSSIPSNYLGTHNHLYLGSDALFWLAGVHADRATHTFNFFFFSSTGHHLPGLSTSALQRLDLLFVDCMMIFPKIFESFYLVIFMVFSQGYAFSGQLNAIKCLCNLLQHQLSLHQES